MIPRAFCHPSDLTEGGRRLYSDEDLHKFQLVCTLKAIGLSLEGVDTVGVRIFASPCGLACGQTGALRQFAFGKPRGRKDVCQYCVHSL